jgi:perosamine synthetase
MEAREIAPGAPAAAGTVPLCVPEIGEAERAVVADVVASGWVSSAGPAVDQFESEVADLVGASHAVATVNGTAALHLALLVAGVEPGDEVCVPALTFISPANAIAYAGAVPIFIDAEPRFWQMDPRALETFLAEECEERDGSLVDRGTGRRVAAVLPVHLLGHPADIAPIRELAARFGIELIEDACEGLGAEYRDGDEWHPVGRPESVACLSFNGNKIITAGGGGMLMTHDAERAERARYLSTQAKDDPLEYVHGAVGFNYRLSNVHAALGHAQLARLDEFVAAKRRIAAGYAEALTSVAGVTPMPEADWARSSNWMFTVLVEPEAFGKDSRELMAHLDQAGVQARPLWQPLHRSPAHAGAPRRTCPVADQLYAQALSLPCSVGLSRRDQDRVIAAIHDAAG